MWWYLAIPAVFVGKAIYDAFTEDDPPPPPGARTTLEKNFDRLGCELYAESGKKIAILGQPGAGKSSLVKRLSNGSVKPPPMIGVATDATNWADSERVNLLSRWDNFIVADVPGYDTSTHPTDKFSSCFPFCAFDSFVLVIKNKIHSSDEEIYRQISIYNKPICIVRSFSDGLDDRDIPIARSDIQKRFPGSRQDFIVFASNRTGDGINEILKRL
jgi:GTPase SAR1 family protein